MKSLFFICILFRKFYKNKKYWIVLKTYSISYEESIYWLWKLRIAYFGKSIWLVFIIFWWSLCCENKTFCIYQPFLSPNKRPAKNYCAYLKNHEMFKDPGFKTFVPIEHSTIVPIFSKTLDLRWTTFSNEQEHIFFFIFNILSKRVHGDF